MRIDRRLNLVVPIYEDGAESSPIIAYVHSTPLSEAVVDRYFMILGKTYSTIWTEGLGFAAGPGHAARVLRHLAEREGIWADGKDAKGGVVPGVERGLLSEIRRLTNVMTMQADGRWISVPWDVAVNQGQLSEEDQREVENAVVFFIAGYATLNRGQREAVLDQAVKIWAAQLTSSTSTEFCNSLKISTETGSSGKKSHATVTAAGPDANAALSPPRRQVPL